MIFKKKISRKILHHAASFGLNDLTRKYIFFSRPIFCSVDYEVHYTSYKSLVISSQVLSNFFSASDIIEAVRGHFCFYGMNAI